MANLFFNQTKTSKKEALRTLREYVGERIDLVFDVCFQTDHGGVHIVCVMEVENPAEQLDPEVSNVIWAPRWSGWRYVLLKVPTGYIDAVMHAELEENFE